LQTEQQLLHSFSEGDATAADVLIHRYEDKLYNLCFRLTSNRQDAEDLFQQTWLKVLQKPKAFVPKSFQNWLYTICLNAYRDNYRKSLRRSHLTADIPDEALAEIVSPTDSAEVEAMNGIVQAMLMNQIGQLPDKLRLPILLCYFEDLDYREIAQVLKVPTGTVKSRLNTAKKRLRAEMESEADV